MVDPIQADVTVHHDTGVVDKDENGVAAIIRAFLHHPVAAVEIIVFIGTMYGLWYSVQTKIEAASATSEAHYRDLNETSEKRYAQLVAKVDTLSTVEAEQRAKIDSSYTRSDTRYATVLAKLSEHDVDIAKMSAGIEFLVKQADKASDKRSELIIPSLPHNLLPGSP